MKDDIVKFLHNPGCRCNRPLYVNILKNAKEQLKAYYPDREDISEDEVVKLTQELNADSIVVQRSEIQNTWTVINCHVNELENKLKEFAIGRKQVSVARFDDQITCVINEITTN